MLEWSRANYNGVLDDSGKHYYDFTSAIFTANVGHGNRTVINAVKGVLNRPLLNTYGYGSLQKKAYLKRLIQFSGFEKAFLFSAGTEATEAALKIMRSGERQGVITIKGNFHGKTMGAETMNGNIPDGNIHQIPFSHTFDYNYKRPGDSLSGVDLSETCGVMLESFQGWQAMPYFKHFVQDIETVCKENDILLCFDEIQTGFGRTGKKFGYEHYGVQPDLICCGKGMGSGFPLSAVLGSEELLQGEMTSTHGGNPVSCAAGLATIDEIERLDLINESARKGIIFHQRLLDIKNKHGLEWAFGKGLYGALIFRTPFLANKVVKKCEENGLLVVHTGRESVKLAPPLTISDNALNIGLDILDECI